MTTAPATSKGTMIAIGVGLLGLGAAIGGVSVYFFVKYQNDKKASDQALANAAASKPTPTPASQDAVVANSKAPTKREPHQGTKNDANPDDSI
ncbi:MAG: transmembrane domain-containing protein [Methylococcales bacterium]|nr:transmembrane domain-containing protein [Methylococcales bacterium]